MRIPLEFDPREHDYGPASRSVRAILAEWTAIEWFVPPAAPGDAGQRLFLEHQALLHAAAPELAAASVRVQTEVASWPELGKACDRVRQQTKHDWKFGVLKKVAASHARQRAWSIDDEALRYPLDQIRTGDLLHRTEKFVMWGNFLSWRPDDLARLPEAAREHATFYLVYAHADLLDCIEWQLAERGDDLSTNPFWPLLGCYRAGYYPFSLSPSSVLLFQFGADEAALPRARLLR